MAGKWHVTRFIAPEGPKHNWPLQRGFDHYFGTLAGAGSYFTPSTLTLGNDPAEPPGESFYYTDAIAEHSADYIAAHQRDHPTEPFFLYVAFTAPHWPLHAPADAIARYRGSYMKGWDQLRLERHQRMIETGLVDGAWPLTPRDTEASAWEDVPATKREEMDLRMAIYAAQIDIMDRGVGRVVEALRQSGRLDNALILFMSDNGACAETGPWGFDRKPIDRLGDDSSFSSYGLSWANASNTPFRLYKHWVHEGGIASPLIAHWPGGIAARGELRHQPGHVIDIMATCLDAAGAQYPTESHGNAVKPLAGRSLIPAFTNQPIERDAIYWEHEGNRAVRRGQWKIVSKHPGAWELYDLQADRTELADKSADQPAIAAELKAAYQAWADACGVQPWPIKPPPGSDKREFDLKAGDELGPGEAPRVARTTLSIEAAVTAGEGVIVAHGGSRVGYSLYVKNGRPCLAIRPRKDARAVITGDAALPLGEFVLTAQVLAGGRMKLLVNGQQVAAGSAGELLTDTPAEGLQVGKDTGAAVGEYRVPSEYTGTIKRVHIKLGE